MPLDLQLGLEPAVTLVQGTREGADERQVAGPLAVRCPAAPVDPANRLGIQPDPGVEGEAAAVYAACLDPPGPPVSERVRELLRRRNRLARQPESAWEHARATARDEAEGKVVPVDPVQGFVEATVAGEDDHGVGALVGSLACELDGVTRMVGAHRAHVRGAHQRTLDCRHPLVVDPGRVWIHDQDGALHPPVSMPDQAGVA